MELKSSFRLLEKDSESKLNILFELTTLPTDRWISVFNENTKNIKAIKIVREDKSESVVLILKDYSKNIKKNELFNDVLSIIKNVDKDILDSQIEASWTWKGIVFKNVNIKDRKLISSLKSGNVVIHDGLSYSDAQYEQYLIKINNNSII